MTVEIPIEAGSRKRPCMERLSTMPVPLRSNFERPIKNENGLVFFKIIINI